MDDWLVFNDNVDIFGSEAKKNCLCKFDDGTVIRYKDEHPFAILTHFKLKSHNRHYEISAKSLHPNFATQSFS